MQKPREEFLARHYTILCVEVANEIMNINDPSDLHGVIFSLSHSKTDELIL